MIPSFIFSAIDAANCTASKTFLGIPAWYKYLQVEYRQSKVEGVEGVCRVIIGDNFSKVYLIGLGAIDILLHIAGMAAVGYVIYGGIRYVLSEGEPENVKSAKRTIIGAMIGLAICIVAAGVVSFIGRQLAK